LKKNWVKLQNPTKSIWLGFT